MEDEKPAVRRVPTSGVHVAITIAHESDHNFWSDLSFDPAKTGGVFVATFHPIALGTLVHLLVTIANETPFAAQGVVRWTRPHRDGSDGVAGIGIAFLDLDEPARERVATFARDVREPLVFELDDAPMRKRA